MLLVSTLDGMLLVLWPVRSKCFCSVAPFVPPPLVDDETTKNPKKNPYDYSASPEIEVGVTITKKGGTCRPYGLRP